MLAQHSPVATAAAAPEGLACARLLQYGVLSVTGEDARTFLHAQLTVDVAHLPVDRGAIAGWCSAKGRLLASFLVVPAPEGFLLVLARDLAGAMAKRLAMFVLRSKVRIAEVTAQWSVLGVWGGGAGARLAEAGLEPADEAYAAAQAGDAIALRVDAERFLVLVAGAAADEFVRRTGDALAEESAWRLREIRSGRALITQATQDQFVPQMVNLEAIGGVDFRKGCYPGQEVVARTQYRGQLKRRMVRAILPAGVEVHDGESLYGGEERDDSPGGTVVNVAPAPDGTEILAVVPLAALEQGAPMRAHPGEPPLKVLPLPYSA